MCDILFLYVPFTHFLDTALLCSFLLSHISPVHITTFYTNFPKSVFESTALLHKQNSINPFKIPLEEPCSQKYVTLFLCIDYCIFITQCQLFSLLFVNIM